MACGRSARSRSGGFRRSRHFAHCSPQLLLRVASSMRLRPGATDGKLGMTEFSCEWSKSFWARYASPHFLSRYSNVL
jgi:hypothetical protein